MTNPFSLEGKNAWITGASYGIGFNIAKAFVAAGVKNIIFNDINEAALERGLANYKEANIEGWFKAGATCVGMGSNLFPKDAIAAGDWAKISQLCAEAIDIVKQVR